MAAPARAIRCAGRCKSFWYPTWLAQPAALVEGSKLIDAPPHRLVARRHAAGGEGNATWSCCTPRRRRSRPTCKTVRALKAANPKLKIGMIGAKVAVDAAGSLQACEELDFVARNEFDFTIKEVAEGRDFGGIKGLSYRTPDGRIVHNDEREILHNMDELPFVSPVYKRDLVIENYFIGYLQHPYMSFYTGRGCKSRCTFCLWPQTVGGHTLPHPQRRPRHRRAEVGEAGVPAGQGSLLRRRHADRQSAAGRGTGARDRQARHHLVLQRQGQRAAQDARSDGATTGCRLLLVGYEIRQPADPAQHQEGHAGRRRARASPRTATSWASRSTAPSSWACRARPRKPSRRPSGSRPRSIRTPSRFRWPRPIRARSSTSRRRRTAGSTPTTPIWSTTTASRSRR